MGKRKSECTGPINDPASYRPIDLKPFTKKCFENEVKKLLGIKYKDKKSTNEEAEKIAINNSGSSSLTFDPSDTLSYGQTNKVISCGDTQVENCKPIINEPVNSFESREELDKYLKEWQDRLFLSDWIIKVNIIPADEYNEVDSTGYCDCWSMHNTASIYLKEYNEKDNSPKKIPQELCLVHELLHLKIERIDKDSKDPFVKRYNDNIHQLVEQQAVSLLCAKYNITKDWFKNF